MKHGPTTSLWSQLSGQQQVKAIQSNQRRKHKQARFWPPYFGMRKVFCLSVTLIKEEPSIANNYIALLAHLKEEIAKNEEKKVLFYQDNAPCHKSIATMAKLHELLLHPPYCPDLAPSDYWLFANIKRMLQGKKFGFNEEVISETKVYFEAKHKSFHKKA